MNHHGLLILDKPTGITSREAIDRAAKWFPRKTKIGHAGTLDPLATGVLVLAIGQATRLVEYVQLMPKVYRTRIVLGATSDTNDADGTITSSSTANAIDESTLHTALRGFVGKIDQIPPAYSAAHVDGRRAYDLARRGNEVALAPRKVRIDQIDVHCFSWPDLVCEIHCGKGTYIRSIARDLGAMLGVGGYVAELRRLSIGPFTVDDSVTLEADSTTALSKVLPMRMALRDMAEATISDDEASRMRHGQSIRIPGEGPMALIDQRGNLIAIGNAARGTFRPDKVFPAS